jgi:tetratricopeptide (TPR) repeat protein
VLVALVLTALGWSTLAARGQRAAYDAAYSEGEEDLAALRYADAAAAYRRALATRETSAALVGLGHALQGAEQLDAAREAFHRAIALDDRSADAYIGLGRIGLSEQRPDEARSAFQRYLSLEPEGRHADEARAALAAVR